MQKNGRKNHLWILGHFARLAKMVDLIDFRGQNHQNRGLGVHFGVWNPDFQGQKIEKTPFFAKKRIFCHIAKIQKIEKTPFFAKKRIFLAENPKNGKNRHFLGFFQQKLHPPIVGT